ncbi:FAD-binding oxidoreductase [Pandoraea bronchicola]|uniref:FAD-binding oxidoreductase n=1 Tax=Pandoraea bronchicola TaxID=2508287 RepID=A0A5E5BU66_9BURK|nr:FAD-binding oxidoreductase [Pandoraea bronchicola]
MRLEFLRASGYMPSAPAHSELMLAAQRLRVAQWRARGAPVEMLDRDEVTARIGCAIY